jgi:hypothetical protein
MAILDPFGYGTHDVLNQAPAMADYDAYSHDPVLGEILSTFNADGPRQTQARSADGSVPPACKSWRGRPTATFPNCAHRIVGVVSSTR